MRRPPSIRGLSFLEILVVLSLVTIISILVAGLFTSSLRISTREAVTLEMEQTCHFLLEKIESALNSSGTRGVSYLSDPEWEGVAVDPIVDVTSEGELAWSNQPVFYFWSRKAGELFVLQKTEGSSLSPIPITYTTDQLIDFAQSGTGSKIGDGVTDFEVSNSRPDGSGRMITLVVELVRQLPNEEPRRFRLTRSLVMLN